MRLIQDLTGKVFGRLTAKWPEQRTRDNSDWYWLCFCTCGNERLIRAKVLKKGYARSCGCLQKERASQTNRTHGASRTPEHRAWCAMWTRCTNKKQKSYANYGGRGITVDPRWKDFAVFLQDMGHKPSPKHSLERIDNEANYGPTNCTWATRRQQANNTRVTRYLTLGNERLSLSAWAQRLGVPRQTIAQRLCRGATDEEALTKPYRHAK